ncbi:MAG: DNA polymerase III subunit gamma/tau [Bacilli bacterium]|nr:DNA polymerase III subunit gamma/tau [Bacilli bacterium]
MEYQALYRKYRPKTFDDVYGQKIIVQTLKNIIKNNKLTHAYLFIGPRGTGKTSIAKIFAKTINCLNSNDGISCEKCDICTNINNNENIDIIEMDAASNNGVDEIREIKNHVTLLPTVSKYKVYIIDEVHMLTTGAFNALLKTLEEPPKHVIFILATTEPHKIPLTIISRCQSFEFKPIPKNIIKERLNYICKKEKIKIDDKSLDLIAIDSNGGLRDAISMLDQLNAYSNGNIQFENVLLLNGRVSDDDLLEIINNIYDCNLNDVFKIIDKIDNDGKNFVYISEDMIKILRNELLNYQLNNSSKLIKKITKEKILDIILLINRSINDMKNSNDKRIFFDILILKIYEIINNNNKQTNVLLKNEISTGNKDDITKKIPVDNLKNDKKENNIDFSLYDDLMNIRLNNILATASKKDLVDYKEKLNSIDMEIINLDQLRIANILNDFDIKAASSSGIVLTTSSDNLIHDIYNELINVDKYITDILKRDIKVCVILIDEWNKKREVYIKKIKNKEKIEILEEKEILDKIINKFSNKSNEFDDLLEIGGE